MDAPLDRRRSRAGGRAGRLGRARHARPGHVAVHLFLHVLDVFHAPGRSGAGTPHKRRSVACELGRRGWPGPAGPAAAPVSSPIARDVGRLMMGGDAVAFEVWGTTARLLVTDPGRLERARSELDAELEAMGDACDRFRADSELSRLNAGDGRPVAVSLLLSQTLGHALRVAESTGGVVDPTVGGALIAAGYDRDLAEVRRRPRGSGVVFRPAIGWRMVRLDGDTVRLPAGVVLDLGATAKAFCADRAAERAALAAGCGVLVSLGGDIAVSGPPPAGGWRVRVADDHRAGPRDPGQDITITTGGLATSSVTVRRWRSGNRRLHHIIDPATGAPADSCWRTVSVAAATCVDANAAATAALIKGRQAGAWLACHRLPARLVDSTGSSITVAGWPAGAASGDAAGDDGPSRRALDGHGT